MYKVHVYIPLQIMIFLRTNITYCRRDAYGILLNKIPSLNDETIHKMRDFVSAKVVPTRGLVLNPRPFAPEDHKPDDEQVNFSKFPQRKCTIILASSFSEDIQLQLERGKIEPTLHIANYTQVRLYNVTMHKPVILCQL